MMDRIVITGMGVLSPAGLTLEEFWNTLVSAKPVYGPLPEWADDDRYRVKLGARLQRYDWAKDLPLKSYGKAACYCMAAAARAMEDAGLSRRSMGTRRVAVIIGTTMGEIQEEEALTERLYGGAEGDKTVFCRKYPAYHIAHAAAELCRASGPCYVVPAACAAGNYAIAMAKRLLDGHYADIVLAGGVDVFSKVAFAGFQRLLSLAPDVCRPFDKERRGLVLGEGCGVVVMEREKERMGGRQYGYVLGTGLASNAYHMTAPHISGEGEGNAIRRAIADAGLCTEEIDYISAHGTGTKANDRMEAMAIQRIFGGRKLPPVSSIKSVLGHSMGAASMLEVIACCLMMERNLLLPTANYQTPDEECPIDVVANQPREGKLHYVLSNSFAFGGQTSCVALGKIMGNYGKEGAR